MTATVDAPGTTYVSVRGVRIRVRETGDPAGPPVLLLHGIGRSLEDWAPQHDRFDAEFRVLSVDLPGYGLSQRMPETTTLATLADGVAATLDSVGERRPVHLMGNSLGGAVALQMLARDPSRVQTLALVNSAGFGRGVTSMLRVLAVPGLGRMLLSRTDPRTARHVERQQFHDRAYATEARIAHALRVAAQPDRVPVFLETARALGTFRGVRPAWRSTLLREVAAHPRPTLIVWGDRDLILPATQLAAARTALPHARSHMFADTGHMPQIERADDFAALVRRFLAEAQTEAPA
ncbi:pimeloyl-ACP methyl ester carboxylesterase [Krasilnikovia cinnamomea]|uniref:Pimeloyl-ACP methyl ester carboxylesterase n=1 Tax=Krasilnikovia cinnamomea TaxID=349313 RepID=A0A4Q7ZSZ3_9ACTN|nr:alpha/beta fold hydrolase [Krasilnikovia cinnamomea]RZU54338.1 pimeloyl-ACP methyl ester carboxylesterase [Krasilnikovia cinnamomea]